MDSKADRVGSCLRHMTEAAAILMHGIVRREAPSALVARAAAVEFWAGHVRAHLEIMAEGREGPPAFRPARMSSGAR